MPGVLTAAQLTALQGFAAGTLDLTANTTRKSGTGLDGVGHPTPAWPALLTGVACGMSEPTVTDLQKYPELFIGEERRGEVKLPPPAGGTKEEPPTPDTLAPPLPPAD